MKRKYKPGYYVEFGGHEKAQSTINSSAQSQTKNKKETTIISNKKQEAPVAEMLINREEKETVEYPFTASNDNKIKASSINNKRNHKTKILTTITTDIQKEVPAKPSRLKKAIISKFNKKAKSSSSDDDTLFIIEVVFCFFPILSLIAMYLKDDKSITLNFWINLLLYLTVIGWVIFGLLVVLDIINLA